MYAYSVVAYSVVAYLVVALHILKCPAFVMAILKKL